MHAENVMWLVFGLGMEAVLSAIVVRMRRDLAAGPQPRPPAAPQIMDEPPRGLARLLSGIDVTTAQGTVRRLLDQGIPAIARVERAYSDRGRLAYLASVLVPEHEQQRASELVLGLPREGEASDDEIEQALCQDEPPSG